MDPVAIRGGINARIFSQLRRRNAVESRPFRDIASQLMVLVNERDRLERERALSGAAGIMQSGFADDALAGSEATLTSLTSSSTSASTSSAAGSTKGKKGNSQQKELVRRLRAELRQLCEESARQQREAQSLESDVASARGEVTRHAEAIVELGERLRVATAEIADLQAALRERDQAVAFVRDENEKLRTEVEKVREEAQKARLAEEAMCARIMTEKAALAEQMNIVMEMKAQAAKGARERELADRADSLGLADALRGGGGDLRHRRVGTGGQHGGGDTSPLPVSVGRAVQGAHGDCVNAIAFDSAAPSLARFATASTDATVTVWDGFTVCAPGGLRGTGGRKVGTFGGWSGGVLSVSISPSSALVLAGGSEGSARIYEMRSLNTAAGSGGGGSGGGGSGGGHAKHVLTGHRGKVQACTFAPDGRHAVTGSHDRTLNVWDVNSGGCLRTIICMSACNDVEVSPDGNVIYSAHQDGKVRLWDLRTGSAIKEVPGVHGGAATCVTLAPDLSSLATVSRSDSTVRLLDPRTLKPTNTLIDTSFQVACNWHQVCFSPCGSYVASGSATGEVVVWDAARGSVAKRLEGHRAPVYSVAWGADPGGLVSGDKDKCIIAWEPAME